MSRSHSASYRPKVIPYAEELALLYQALGSKLGLVVRVTDFDLCRVRLYKARKEADDPDLSVIQLRRSPFEPDTIWIVRSAPIPSEAPVEET